MSSYTQEQMVLDSTIFKLQNTFKNQYYAEGNLNFVYFVNLMG